MTQSLQIGPLALPYTLLLTLASIGLGGFIAQRLARRRGIDAEPLLLRMLLVGAVAARLAFVWQWRAAYLAEPLSILDIRDGGWDAAFGLAAAALYGLHCTRDERRLKLPVVAAVVTSGLLWAAGSVALGMGLRNGVPLPALTLSSLDGRSVALAGFAGRPTVINLWATWCPPCRREMPVLAQAQTAHPGINFVFLNQGESSAVIQRYLDREGLSMRNVLVDTRLEAGAALGHRALPTTLFFNSDGRLVGTRVGELSAATLAQRLAALRAGLPASAPSSPSH